MPTDETERTLRAALERLVTGTPVRSDGRLTVTGLAREAGVSRATVYRSRTIVSDLNAAAERPHAPTRTRPSDDPQLRERLEQLTNEVAVLRTEKEALANALYAITTERRAAPSSQGGPIVNDDGRP